jgi:hypothetical protein
MADVFRTRPGAARKEIEEIMRYSTKDDLPGIKCPTLIIGGSFDPLAPARQSRVMHDLIPNSELHIVPTGHVGKMLRSELYNPHILDFLARHYPPSQPKSPAKPPAEPLGKPRAEKPAEKASKKVAKKKPTAKKAVRKKKTANEIKK